MTFVKQIAGAPAVGVAMLIGSGLCAQAGFIVTLTQQGSDVVATGSGTINLVDLTSVGSESASAFISSIAPAIFTGPTSAVLVTIYFGLTAGPGIIGPGARSVNASSGSGDLVGIDRHDGDLFVPSGYHSGDPLSDSSTYANQTFSSLGVAPGTYVYPWGSGPTADSFTLQIGSPAAVPEPASIMLLVLPLGFVIWSMIAAKSSRAASA
jgi:hypothetical protein